MEAPENSVVVYDPQTCSTTITAPNGASIVMNDGKVVKEAVMLTTDGQKTITVGPTRPALLDSVLMPEGTDFYNDETWVQDEKGVWRKKYVKDLDTKWIKTDTGWKYTGPKATTTYKAWKPAVERVDELYVPPATCESFALLRQMLWYKRRGRTRTERKFINRFLAPLDMKIDGYGNYYKVIGTAPVMWACHTDSVHSQGGTQQLRYDPKYGIITLADGETSNCLGADDAAGIFVMVEMIKRGVEGVYVFHRDEESGGGGSTHFAKHSKHIYEHCKMCISLDRYGYDSVITHQGGRCCSDEFANDLAAALNDQHELFAFVKDSGGLFTDSANYTDDIPECTNLSVGYFGHHREYEEVSVPHLLRLVDALSVIDVTTLAIKRNVTDGYGKWDYGDDRWWEDEAIKGRLQPGGNRLTTDEIDDIVNQARDEANYTIGDLVAEYPDETADILEQMGYDVQNLILDLRQRGAAL